MRIPCAKSFLRMVQKPVRCGRLVSKATWRTVGNGARSASGRAPVDVGGVFPPLTTPFNPDESIAYDKLEHNVRLWNQVPFRGYVVQGSNGEYCYLRWEDRIELVRRVAQLASPDKLIVAGSGCESTQDTITMTLQMADAGAQMVLVITPYYYKGGMTNSALVTHFTKVADNSPVPVLLYSVPANTGIDLAPEVVVELADHPNIIGLKDSGGDISKLGGLLYSTKDKEFHILAGSASFLYPALTIGCVGGVCALANVLGKEVCTLQMLYAEGKHSEARDLQQRLVGPNLAVTRKFGVAGLKMSMEWFGYYGGQPRLPLEKLNQDKVAALKQYFINSGFLT